MLHPLEQPGLGQAEARNSIQLSHMGDKSSCPCAPPIISQGAHR